VRLKEMAGAAQAVASLPDIAPRAEAEIT
jgi:hypothetical protein